MTQTPGQPGPRPSSIRSRIVRAVIGGILVLAAIAIAGLLWKAFSGRASWGDTPFVIRLDGAETALVFEKGTFAEVPLADLPAETVRTELDPELAALGLMASSDAQDYQVTVGETTIRDAKNPQQLAGTGMVAVQTTEGIAACGPDGACETIYRFVRAALGPVAYAIDATRLLVIAPHVGDAQRFAVVIGTPVRLEAAGTIENRILADASALAFDPAFPDRVLAMSLAPSPLEARGEATDPDGNATTTAATLPATRVIVCAVDGAFAETQTSSCAEHEIAGSYAQGTITASSPSHD